MIEIIIIFSLVTTNVVRLRVASTIFHRMLKKGYLLSTEFLLEKTKENHVDKFN